MHHRETKKKNIFDEEVIKKAQNPKRGLRRPKPTQGAAPKRRPRGPTGDPSPRTMKPATTLDRKKNGDCGDRSNLFLSKLILFFFFVADKRKKNTLEPLPPPCKGGKGGEKIKTVNAPSLCTPKTAIFNLRLVAN